MASLAVAHDAQSEVAQHLRLASTRETPATPRREPVTIDAMFLALDGQELMVGDRSWSAEVYGISDQFGARWIQLRLRGRPSYSVVLELRNTDSIEHVNIALASRLAENDQAEALTTVA